MVFLSTCIPPREAIVKAHSPEAGVSGFRCTLSRTVTQRSQRSLVPMIYFTGVTGVHNIRFAYSKGISYEYSASYGWDLVRLMIQCKKMATYSDVEPSLMASISGSYNMSDKCGE